MTQDSNSVLTTVTLIYDPDSDPNNVTKSESTTVVISGIPITLGRGYNYLGTELYYELSKLYWFNSAITGVFHGILTADSDTTESDELLSTEVDEPEDE